MPRTIGSTGEAGVIKLISRWLANQAAGKRLRAGIGDDCAILKRSPGPLLFTTDSFVEGVHFRRVWTTPFKAGWKALAVNISDIAAGGGTPLAALISLELPFQLELGWLKGFYTGLLKAGHNYGVALAGGNISRGRGFSAHIALIGEAPRRLIGRGGAKPGQVLAVTGNLGGSLAGLLSLKRGFRSRIARRMIRRHLLPRPSLMAGRLLAGCSGALIDISDGLLREARHIADASQVRISIDPGKLPISRDLPRLACSLGKDPVSLALNGGEEYELLACIPPRIYSRIALRLRKRSVKLTAIGQVRQGRGVRVSGSPVTGSCGFDHFG